MNLELKEQLYNPLPKEAIKPHPTKTYLSSIKGIYITDRFNEVFGVGKWQTHVECVERNESGTVIVLVTFTVPELGISYQSFGGNDNGGVNSKGFDLGDAYKGATTDALSKIGSFMGVGIDVYKGNPNAAPKAPEQPKVQAPKAPAKKEEKLDDRKAAALTAFKAIDFSKVISVLVKDYKLTYTKLEDFIAGETIERILEVYAKVK